MFHDAVLWSQRPHESRPTVYNTQWTPPTSVSSLCGTHSVLLPSQQHPSEDVVLAPRRGWPAGLRSVAPRPIAGSDIQSRDQSQPPPPPPILLSKRVLPPCPPPRPSAPLFTLRSPIPRCHRNCLVVLRSYWVTCPCRFVNALPALDSSSSRDRYYTGLLDSRSRQATSPQARRTHFNLPLCCSRLACR